jgi:hypothetical protein
MLATGTTDPILATLAEHEVRWIEETAKLTDQVAVVAWQLSPPIGARPLMSLLAPESTRGLVAAAG